MPIPERSKARRAASKPFRGPGGIQHAAMLSAVKTKPSRPSPLGGAEAPALTATGRGSTGFVHGRGEGMLQPNKGMAAGFAL